MTWVCDIKQDQQGSIKEVEGYITMVSVSKNKQTLKLEFAIKHPPKTDEELEELYKWLTDPVEQTIVMTREKRGD